MNIYLEAAECGVAVGSDAKGCECHFGDASYLQVFDVGDRKRIFELCGPHPTIYVLRLAAKRCGVSVNFPPEWRLARGEQGMVLFTDPEAKLSGSLRGAVSRDYGRDWMPLWMQGALPIVSSLRCHPFAACYTPQIDGFCYLDLYPRSEWQDLGCSLGPWPELKSLPSGRFPAAAVSAVAVFARNMCERLAVHCQRADEECPIDGLTVFPETVVIGGVSYGQPSVTSDDGGPVVLSPELARLLMSPDADVMFVRDGVGMRLPGIRPEVASDGVHLVAQDLGEGEGNACALSGPHWILEFQAGATPVFDKYRLMCERRTLVYGHGNFSFRLPAGDPPLVRVCSKGEWSVALVEHLGFDRGGIAVRHMVHQRAGVGFRSATWSQPSMDTTRVKFRPWFTDDADDPAWCGEKTYGLRLPCRATMSGSQFGYVVDAGSSRVVAGALEVVAGGRAALFARADPRDAVVGLSRVDCEFIPDGSIPDVPVLALTVMERLDYMSGRYFRSDPGGPPRCSCTVTVVEDEGVVGFYDLPGKEMSLDLDSCGLHEVE